MVRLFICVLLLAATVPAQVLEITGGQSTLMGGAGAGVTAFLPNQTVKLGVGTAGGHFAVGVSDSFSFRGFSTTVGDSSFGYSVDGIGGAGLQVRGLSIQQARPDETFAAFVGSTGSAYQLPFYSAGTNQHLGAGVYWHKRHGRLQLSSLAAFSGGQRTALQSVSFTAQRFHFSGGGGIVSGQKTATALLEFQPIKEIHFAGMHQDLFWQGQTAAVNSASIFTTLGRFTANATALAGQSSGRHVSGESAGAALRFGWLSVQSNIYQASQQRTWSQNVTETFRHWHFQESLTGRSAFAGGLGYQGNKFTAGIDHSVAFVPFAGRGFQQITALTLTFHLPHTDTTATLAATLLPGAGAKYTAAADSFVRGPLNVQGGGGHSAGHSHAQGGRFIVQGIVVDKSGTPVSGAAIVCGGRLVFSDTNGAWAARFRKGSPVAVVLQPEEFTAPGTWAAISAPDMATPSPKPTPLALIVARQ